MCLEISGRSEKIAGCHRKQNRRERQEGKDKKNTQDVSKKTSKESIQHSVAKMKTVQTKTNADMAKHDSKEGSLHYIINTYSYMYLCLAGLHIRGT